MKLSRSIGYAIAALEYITHRHPDSIAAREIASKRQIPVEYLQKVLQHLVRDGILDAVRGPQGGFSLAKSAGKISLYDIYQAVEGGQATDTSRFPCKASKNTIRATVKAYSEAQSQNRKMFRQISLADLVGLTGHSS